MASSSSSSSSNLKRYYHVFLSFRGPDVRDRFLSHLYAGLDQRGIHTFRDSEGLRKGEQISPALMKAIEESRVAIIVFTENYASSPWCLEELARIMECKEQRDLKVFPLFYKVEPREVRTPRESYGEAMAKHESKFGKGSEKVKRWEKALLDAGNLSGWEFHEGDEAELIQRIVKELSVHLQRTPLQVATYPVGIDSRVQQVISLLENGTADDDVRMVGLWGPGGIGKSTIAKAVYNYIEKDFQGTCFLARGTETLNERNGLVSLQRELLSQIFPRGNWTVYNVDGGIPLIRERLCCKKVLLVLDDVDQWDQLNALAGGGHWFGPGSRIIVTSRDKHLLTSHGINCVYEVESLYDDEARDLFGRYAFKNGKKVEITRDLIDGAVQYANGLPLALQVFGSFLCGREKPAWESALRNLSKSPDQTINRILKTSFDGLDANAKDIFLDIACFFKGKSIEYIKEVLDSCCDFESTIGIEVLIERSLITNEHGCLQMHDLIQLMGKDIVIQECPGDPGKRSRLWNFGHVENVLCGETGTNAVKAIVLDSPKPEEIRIGPLAFPNMKMLRMLILLEVHTSSQGPIRLPGELRRLEWPNAPDLDFGSCQKLVRLDLQKSRFKEVGCKSMNFKKLTSINFSKCESLARVPDLSSVPNLESLNLDWCKRLKEVHRSVGYLDKLKFLSLHCCSNLSKFPNELKTKSLQLLNLFGCSKLEEFPDILGKMEHLARLEMGGTAIRELPTSFENLVSVKVMGLSYCKNLATLPSSIHKFHNLEFLSLSGCSKLGMFPKNLEDSTDPDSHLGFPNLYSLGLGGCNLSEVDFLESSSSFPKLEYLLLSENKFTRLPTSINEYHALEVLDVEKCQRLQEIPLLPPNLRALGANGCKSLEKFPDFSSVSSDFLKVYLSSCCEFRRGFKMADVSLPKGFPKMSGVEIGLTGGEIPKCFTHSEDSSMRFSVPKDLYDKFLGLALYFALGPEERKEVCASCEIQIIVNGERVEIRPSFVICSRESDEVWLKYFPRRELGGIDNLLRDEWSQFQVYLEPRGGSLKKCGFRLICEKPEDEGRVVLQHHQPNKANWIPEETDSDKGDSIDTVDEYSPSDADAEASRSTLTKNHPRILSLAPNILRRTTAIPKNYPTMAFKANPFSLTVPEHALKSWLRDSELLDQRSSSLAAATAADTSSSGNDAASDPYGPEFFASVFSSLGTLLSLVTLNPPSKLTTDDFSGETPSWTHGFIGSCDSYSFPSSPTQARLRFHENVKRFARNYATLFILFFACALKEAGEDYCGNVANRY